MSAGRNELFNFETSPFIIASGVIETDGTTSAQDFRTGAARLVNGSGGDALCEPEQLISSGNESYILDAFSRLIVICGSRVGLGTWNLDIEFRRANSATNAVAIPTISMPQVGADEESSIFVFDDPFPSDFMKSIGGGESLADILSVRMTVTPTNAVTAAVFATVLLVPGFVAGASNKGANLSAPQFLTYR